MTFTNEADFEKALIDILSQKYGWESQVAVNPSVAITEGTDINKTKGQNCSRNKGIHISPGS